MAKLQDAACTTGSQMTSFCLLMLAPSVWKWIRRLGGPGLILLGILDNTPFVSAPPGSMDVFVILLSAHRHEWWAYYALMATAGEVLGGYLTYRLAEKGGEKTLERKIGKQAAVRIYKQFEKRGFLTVFIGSLLPPPFPFTSVLMAAGIMQYPRQEFLPALTAGRWIRFFLVAFVGRGYGREMIEFFTRHYRSATLALIVVAVMAGIDALVYFKWYRPKVQRKERAGSEQVEEFPVRGPQPRSGRNA